MARKIKFALEMKDGAKVRNSLEELRENFDLEKAIGYFLSGKLTEWLEDRYYEDEAEALDAIDKDAPDLRARLCEALGVECADDADLDVGALERLNEKKAVLRQKTSDESIIANSDKTALTQEDLADLLDMDEPVIYLCGDSFNIPARVKNKKYVGILGTPTISIKASSQEEVDAKGIVFENVQLPWGKKEVINDEAPTVQSTSTAPDNKTWRIPKAQLKSLFISTFKDTFAEYTNFDIDGDYIGTSQVDSSATFLMGKSTDLTEDQKLMALTMICGGKYTEDDLIFMQLEENMSSGWAFTRESFCIVAEGNIADIIPYESLAFEDFYGEFPKGWAQAKLKLSDGKSLAIENMCGWDRSGLFNYLSSLMRLFRK